MSSLMQAKLSLPLLHRGKVRDIFDIDEKHMLIVTTDRLSAFDVVFDKPIPEKGKILTSIANYWFKKTNHIIQNHLTEVSLEAVLPPQEVSLMRGRAIVVKKLRSLPIEAVIRGYLIGSGWKEYVKTGVICGIKLPSHMELAEKLDQPIFTPSSKADVGAHDENISFIDCQMTNPFLTSMGAKEIKREEFIDAQQRAINTQLRQGFWQPRFL